MKPHFYQLTAEQQAIFGNGCTWVPDFAFTAICDIHDFGYVRGGNLLDKLRDDFNMSYRMFIDAFAYELWFLYIWVAIIYYIGITFLPFSYFRFNWGPYKTLDQIIELDNLSKLPITHIKKSKF